MTIFRESGWLSLQLFLTIILVILLNIMIIWVIITGEGYYKNSRENKKNERIYKDSTRLGKIKLGKIRKLIKLKKHNKNKHQNDIINRTKKKQ